jgi:hypothetical protein
MPSLSSHRRLPSKYRGVAAETYPTVVDSLLFTRSVRKTRFLMAQLLSRLLSAQTNFVSDSWIKGA